MERLEVEFTGDVKQLNKATDDAIKELKNFDKQANKSLDFDKPSKKAVKGFRNIKTATANANPTLQEFSRVIQDAPFGIQGVGNNITQLVSNFGNLSRATGGSVGALKALASSFLGPGGILFAVSTVVSLLTVYGDELFKSQTETQRLAAETEKAKKALDDYVNSLDTVNRALLQGSQNAQKELVQLKLLRQAVEDTSKSTNNRLRAVQELRRLFPDYFKDLSDEKILSGDLSIAYNELATSIVKRAKATVLQGAIVKNAEKELAITRQLTDETEKRAKAQDELNSKFPIAPSRFTNSIGVVAAGRQEFDQLTGSINDSTQEIGNLGSALANIVEENKTLLSQLASLGGIDLSKSKITTQDIEPKSVILPKNTLIESLKESGKQGEEIAKSFQEGVIKKFNDGSLQEVSNILSNLIGESLIKGNAIIDRLLDNIDATIQTKLSSTISSIGGSIGEALINGTSVLEAAGNQILRGLGGFLSDMGKLLVEYGTLAVLKGKLDLAIAAGGPIAIGAGLAAIAVGTALSAAGSALGSIANRGSISGVSSGGASGGPTTRNSTITTNGGGFGDGTVVFEIAGTKLVGVLNRTLNRNLAIGG